MYTLMLQMDDEPYEERRRRFEAATDEVALRRARDERALMGAEWRIARLSEEPASLPLRAHAVGHPQLVRNLDELIDGWEAALAELRHLHGLGAELELDGRAEVAVDGNAVFLRYPADESLA